MAQHTPGPWVYRPHEYDDWGIVRIAGRDDTGFQRVICQANFVASPDELTAHRANKTDPAEADARLIAAAPELLAVLEEVFADFGKVHSIAWTDKAGEAITKARGVVTTHPKPGWASHALSIASDEVDDAREYLERAMGMLDDLAHQVEAADKAFAAVSEPHEVAYVQFSDCGQHIRKWSRSPFEGGRKCRIEIAATCACGLCLECDARAYHADVHKDRLKAGHESLTCTSCGGLNTACPMGCARDPKTGELIPVANGDAP